MHCRSLERDLERSRADHISEMENVMEKHRQTVSENKKKQWVSRWSGHNVQQAD